MTRSERRTFWAIVLPWLLALAILFGLGLPATVSADTDPSLTPLPVTEIINSASARWGVSSERMTCIAWRESAFRPWATSPDGHRGLWQFSDQTWAWASRAIDLGDTSPYDAEASTEVAASIMAQGGWSHWSTAQWC